MMAAFWLGVIVGMAGVVAVVAIAVVALLLWDYGTTRGDG